MTIEQKFETLVAMIEHAGQKARQYFDADETASEIKHDGSVVTAIDKMIETQLVAYIRELFPDDSIVGEEGEGYVGTSDFVWHIDPIDGTDNFLRKIPFCAVSVARLGSSREGSFGIIHNPITQQTFSALMDHGVYEKTRVYKLNDDLLGGRAVISISRGRESWMKSASYNLRKAIGTEFGKCDPYGCCALELAYIAANRIDGYLIYGLHSWDYAAGLYLVQSAGGIISVFENGVWSRYTGTIKDLCSEHGKTMFISHGAIHEDALTLIDDPRAWSDE